MGRIVGEPDISSVTRAGLILTGGGARAAYQVGVLKALSQIYPRPDWPFPIIVGTSAGAVSASILAGNVARWHHSISEIEKVWANFRVQQVFRADAGAMLKAGGRWMASLMTGGALGPPKSLLDNSPLRSLLARVTDFDAIRANVTNGDLRALALCATSYFTARSVSFFEAETTVSEWSRAQRHGERVPLTLDYLMASLSIPFLFPPTCLHGEFFGDGAMRQTAPLSPAIHLGADRLLIVGVRPTHLDAVPRFIASDTPPSPGQIFGYMLDTLFSDQISADLENLNRINRLGAVAGSATGARQIRTLMIAPSLDPSELAVRFTKSLPMSLRALMAIIGAAWAAPMSRITSSTARASYQVPTAE